jgi:prepilin-type N-terminal cleavage/methylation domain-containing protein
MSCTTLLHGCHWLRQCSLLRCHTSTALAEPVAPRKSTRGFTLLEIILSLAILAGSLAALGEVMRLADLNASMSRDETDAQIIASSIMDELISGYRPLTAVDQAVLNPEVMPPWLYSIAVEQTELNPDYVPPETQKGESSSSSSSTSSSSSSSSGSSSSLGGAGGQP